MQLDFQRIKEITVGALGIWQEEDGVHFSKCTKEQLAEWKKIGPFVFSNANATTGIRLDFYTDSPYVEVQTSKGNKYEVKINDVLAHQFLKEDEAPFTFKVDLNTDGETSHVVIYLPSHNPNGVIQSITLADGATVTPSRFDKKVLFLGDSIVQGWDSKFDSLSYPYLVSDFLNAESVIQGIGGACFSPSTVVDTGFNPDVVFVAYGTNDFHTLQDIEELKTKAKAFYENVKRVYAGAKIFAITPIWRADGDVSYPIGNFENCCKEIKNLAESEGLNVVDGSKLLPPDKKFLADALHPNDLGFSVIALTLLRILSCEIFD